VSKVTDIRRAIKTLIQNVLPGYVGLSDSYETLDNASTLMIKGYSIGFGPAERATDEFCPGYIRIRRQFQIILTNVYTPNMDAEYRESLENSLMDDEFLVLAALEKDPTLTGENINSFFALDNGLEYLIDDRKQFIICVITASVDYIEET
jgi:hypothetical protein